MSAYNIGDPRDVWLMFMELSGIKREILDDMERDLEQKLVSPNFDPDDLRSMSGFPKKYYIALKMVRLLKQTHREFEEIRDGS